MRLCNTGEQSRVKLGIYGRARRHVHQQLFVLGFIVGSYLASTLSLLIIYLTIYVWISRWFGRYTRQFNQLEKLEAAKAA